MSLLQGLQLTSGSSGVLVPSTPITRELGVQFCQFGPNDPVTSLSSPVQWQSHVSTITDPEMPSSLSLECLTPNVAAMGSRTSDHPSPDVQAET